MPLTSLDNVLLAWNHADLELTELCLSLPPHQWDEGCELPDLASQHFIEVLFIALWHLVINHQYAPLCIYTVSSIFILGHAFFSRKRFGYFLHQGIDERYFIARECKGNGS